MLYVDAFGNVAAQPHARAPRTGPGSCRGRRSSSISPASAYYAVAARTFADARPGDIMLYEDSYRNISVAISGGNAAEMLQARAGQPIRINVGRL